MTQPPLTHLNTVTLHGTLLEDPTLKSVGAKQTPLAVIRVAAQTAQQPVHITVQTWASGATNTAKLRKGDNVLIDGELRSNQYTRRRDGQTITEILIDAAFDGIQHIGPTQQRSAP